MKDINLKIKIHDDWYWAIAIEYDIAKKSNTYTEDFDSFLNEWMNSLIFSDANYEYMSEYLEQYHDYLKEKIPDYGKLT